MGNEKKIKDKINLTQKKLAEIDKEFKKIVKEIDQQEFYYRKEIEAEIVKEENQIRRQSTMEMMTVELQYEIEDKKKKLSEKREKLANIKLVSAQIKEISGVVNEQMLNQRDLIEGIEQNVNEVALNVEKADKEIVEANQIQKGSARKGIIMMGMGGVIVLLLIGLIAVLAVK